MSISRAGAFATRNPWVRQASRARVRMAGRRGHCRRSGKMFQAESWSLFSIASFINITNLLV
jgi:hypothetical protein